jgi:hypothetical protein
MRAAALDTSTIGSRLCVATGSTRASVGTSGASSPGAGRHVRPLGPQGSRGPALGAAAVRPGEGRKGGRERGRPAQAGGERLRRQELRARGRGFPRGGERHRGRGRLPAARKSGRASGRRWTAARPSARTGPGGVIRRRGRRDVRHPRAAHQGCHRYERECVEPGLGCVRLGDAGRSTTTPSAPPPRPSTRSSVPRSLRRDPGRAGPLGRNSGPSGPYGRSRRRDRSGSVRGLAAARLPSGSGAVRQVGQSTVTLADAHAIPPRPSRTTTHTLTVLAESGAVQETSGLSAETPPCMSVPPDT